MNVIKQGGFMSTAVKHSNSNVALGVVLGAAAGIGIGMLVAPRSGKETRSQIRDKVASTAQQATNKASNLKDKALQVTDDTASKTRELADKAADATKREANKISHDAKEMVDKTQKEVHSAARRPASSTS
jgi:gas vesicle protein